MNSLWKKSYFCYMVTGRHDPWVFSSSLLHEPSFTFRAFG